MITKKDDTKQMDRFQLRYAAGSYWLLRKSEEDRYVPPLKMNGLGAQIYEYVCQGMGEEEIVTALQAEYEIDRNQIRGDVSAFLKQLKTYGFTNL